MTRIILLVLSLNSLLLSAQEFCGTNISEEGMQRFYNRDKPYLYNEALRSSATLELPVVYHLTREDDGSEGFKIGEALRLHCELNQRYIDANIQFYILDIITHNNSDYHHMIDGNTGNLMMENENNLDACNIFIVEDAKAGSYPVCGYSYMPENNPGPNRGGIVLDISCSAEGYTTLIHEMGHYLNLAHTFSGWEGHHYYSDPIPSWQWERADGSNCSLAGDGFCNTPPDYISSRWYCTTPKTFEDAVNTTFTVDEKNYMSYALDNCHDYFKEDQMNEMRAAPANFRSYLLNPTAPSSAPLGKPAVYFPLANMSNARHDTVNFEWEDVAGADYYLFELTVNNFNFSIFDTVISTNSLSYYNLNVNQYYSWRVKAFNYGSVCNDFVTNNFTTSDTSSTDFIVTNDAMCFGSNNGNASVISSVAINSYNWYKFNETTLEYSFFNSTTTDITENIYAGKFYVDIHKTSGDVSTKYFEINEPDELMGSIAENGTKLVSFVTGGTQPYTYYWSNAENTHINHHPTNGENSLFLTDNNTCFKMFKYDFVSAIDNIYTNLTKIVLYPNPVNGDNLFVSYDLIKNSKINFELYSSIGNKVFANIETSKEGNNLLEINTKTFSKGIYYLKVTINNNTLTKKVIL